MTDREPVTAILEGGGGDGAVLSCPPSDAAQNAVTRPGASLLWFPREIDDLRLARTVVISPSSPERYNLLTDDYGQPMRDVFGRYRYRVQW